MSDYQVILYERADRVATITMNRPERLNALSPELWGEIDAALAEADRDSEVRCVILTGAGRAFSSGIDLAGDGAPPGQQRPRRGLNDWYAAEMESEQRHRRFRDTSKPVIAAVNGYSVAWGFELAVMCDFIIASDRAQFGAPEIRHGSIVGTMLHWVVPLQYARYLIYSGDLIGAEEAQRIGLALRVVPHDRLTQEAHAFAARLAMVPPLALKLNKRALDGALDMAGLKNGLEYAHLAAAICHTLQDEAETPDGRNLEDIRNTHGLKAFLDARDQPYRLP
ncbi:MAG: enoyl-CoA hydratase/isomerase family protein [Dehalococcoidia bacterium]